MANVVWHMSATEKQLSYKLNINFFPMKTLTLLSLSHVQLSGESSIHSDLLKPQHNQNA